jgi:hypothetical protein
MASNILTQARLKELLQYDPDAGIFVWRVNRPRAKAGQIAGALTMKGHVRIQLDRKVYLAHRLAWLYTHGVWPQNQIDHINRSPQDNRIVNLRDVSHGVNVRNSKMRRTNTSGYKGVSWFAHRRQWAAQISIGGKNVVLGMFDDPKLAAKAYLLAAKKHGLEYGIANH